MKKILLTICSVLLAGSLHAAWDSIDDFEAGTELGDGWTVTLQDAANYQTEPSASVVADPFDEGQGNVLAINPGVAATTSSANGTFEFALPESLQISGAVTESTYTTWYFKVARPIVGDPGVPAEVDVTWGLVADSSRSGETNLFGYGSYSVLGRYEKDGIMDIRDENEIPGSDPPDNYEYVDLTDEALDTNTFYEVWFVIDHFTFTYKQYIKGGTEFPIQTMVYENALYRNQTVDNLDTMLFFTSAGNINEVKGKDPLYFDDFYIDVSGENLTSPDSTWQTIDDFEAGSELGDGWTVTLQDAANYQTAPSAAVVSDPFDAGQGNVLSINPGVAATTSSANGTFEFALPEGQQISGAVTESTYTTWYFRVGRPIVGDPGVPAEVDVTWGLVADSSRSGETNLFGYGSYSVLGRYEKDGIMDIRDENEIPGSDPPDNYEYVDLTDEALDTNTWYEVWFVIDHFTFTYKQYVKGGTEFPEQTMVYENALYRNQTVDNLDTMLFFTSAGNINEVKGKDPLYFDDFYIDVTGMNLTSPGDPVVDTTPRAEAADAGATEITMTVDPGPEVEVGKLIFLNDGTELGKIASIAGRVLTLEAPLAAAVPANSQLTFVTDNTPDTSAGKLINISTRGQVGTLADVLIGGFVIGEQTQEVLIQARGPELAAAGVDGVLADPVLTVTDITDPENPDEIGMNDNWEDTQGQLISDLWGGVPPFSEGSLSAGIVMTLEPGNYTAKIEGKDGTTGVAIIEVFEIDN